MIRSFPHTLHSPPPPPPPPTCSWVNSQNICFQLLFFLILFLHRPLGALGPAIALKPPPSTVTPLRTAQMVATDNLSKNLEQSVRSLAKFYKSRNDVSPRTILFECLLCLKRTDHIFPSFDFIRRSDVFFFFFFFLISSIFSFEI